MALWRIRKEFSVEYKSDEFEAETFEDAKKMYYDGEYEMWEGPDSDANPMLLEVKLEGCDDENEDVFESIEPSDDDQRNI